jgi:hypothetical protein
MSFSLPRFLRKSPIPDLQQYFDAHPGVLPDGFNWDANEHIVRVMLQSIVLQAKASSQVLEDFERIDQLADDIGQRVLRSMLDRQDLLARFDSSEGPEARGIFVLLNAPEMFDRALSVHYAERRYAGRSWSGFRLSGDFTKVDHTGSTAALAGEIKGLFWEFDGTGSNVEIDRFERRGRIQVKDDENRVWHYSIYLEGLPEVTLDFEANKMERRTRRPAIEAAICFDPRACLLDVVSRGGRELRGDLARGFSAHILGAKEDLVPVSPRKHNLDCLKRQMTFGTDAADRIKSVQVTALRLYNPAAPYGRVVLECETNEHRTIWDASDSWFRENDPLKTGIWHVAHARLRIVFHAEGPKKTEQKLLVELRSPNGSNLREQTHRHQLIAEKYLARWGLMDSVV